MEPKLALLPAFFLICVSLFLEAGEVPEVSVRTEAAATIAAEMQARETDGADRKAAIEAVPAFEEWEVDHGNRKTFLRRVAPPVKLLKAYDSTATSESAVPTEEQIAAFMAEQPTNRSLNLTGIVYDQSFTKITWRDEEQSEWTVLSNIDFRYVDGFTHFEDENQRWSSFFLVHEVDSQKEAAFASHAAARGFPYVARSPERWLALLPNDFLTSGKPEYLIVTDGGKTEIPAALYEEMDALHRHYHAHEERLIAEYERNKVLIEARRAWHEANPPEPKDTVINFWRVE